MPTTFERKALYEEVWKTPLTHLGKKYGLSDNGLRKICKALNIPLPVAGYWQRVAAGHKTTRLPLPEEAARTQYRSDPPVASTSYKLDEDDAWLKERTDFDQANPDTLLVDLKPTKWHATIVPLRNRFLEAVKEVDKARVETERYERLPVSAKRSTPNRGYRWHSFITSGKLLIDTYKAFPLKVSILTYERALAIVNALCWSAEARGFTSEFNKESGRIVLTGHGGSVNVRIAEQLDTEIVREKGWDNRLSNSERKKPTGTLRLFLGSLGAERAIEETNKVPLEDRLSAFFPRVYQHIIRCRARAREVKEWHRIHAEDERIRREEANRRAAEERRRTEERQKKESLISEAAQWKQATVLREYIAHLKKLLPANAPETPSSARDWFHWANDLVEETDPTGKRLATLRANPNSPTPAPQPDNFQNA